MILAPVALDAEAGPGEAARTSGASTTGSAIQTVVPWPGSLSNRIRPPAWLTVA
jgi:hypothetical protein